MKNECYDVLGLLSAINSAPGIEIRSASALLKNEGLLVLQAMIRISRDFQGVWTPLFGPRCRLFNIRPKVGLPQDWTPLFFACRRKKMAPLFKNPGSAPAGGSGSSLTVL